MYKFFAFFIIILGFVTSYFINYLSEDGTEPVVLRIGVAAALTGDAAVWGQAMKNGIDLAVSDLAGQGIAVNVIYEDTASDGKQTISAVSKLININEVKSILVSWLDVFQGAESLVKAKEDMVMISPDAGVEGLQYQQNVFSTWYRTEPKVQALINYISGLGFSSMTLILPQDGYYESFGSFVATSCVQKQVECRVEYFNPGASEDFRTLVSKAKEYGAKAIFFSSYDQSDAIAFFRNIQTLYPEVQLFGDEISKDYLEQPELSQYIDSITYLTPHIFSKEFSKRYEGAYGITPSYGAVHSYDSTMILVEAMRAAPGNPARYIREHEFESQAFGVINFDFKNGVETNSEQFELYAFKHGDTVRVK